MGANTLATYLGVCSILDNKHCRLLICVLFLQQEGDKTPLKGAVCISNPWNWTMATDYIENGNWLNRYIYGPILADALLTMFKNSRYAFETDKRLDMKDIYSKRYVEIRWFDNRVTAPLCGYVASKCVP